MKQNNLLLNSSLPHFRVVAIWAALLLVSPSFANTYHVKVDGNDSNDGTSWATAFATLQNALSVSVDGDQIWVAEGTYYPTSGADRGVSFVMKSGVSIYGGFAGSGNPGFGDRNWQTHVTTLSGDIGTPNDQSDNSYHIILNNNNGLTASALIDGFTVSGGYAIGSDFNGGAFGGGILNYYASPAIANCKIIQNTANGGGGVLNSYSNPKFTNCSISENNGNGIQNYFASPILDNCTISGNSGNYGSGMVDQYCSAILTNCAFIGNLAYSQAAAIASYFSSEKLINCSFSGNSTPDGSAFYYYTNADWSASIGVPSLTNCILWGNADEISNATPGFDLVVTYSIVQGGYTGAGNLDVDPLFVSQPPVGMGTTGDLHLQECSPAKDAGTSTGAPGTDFDGDLRPQGTGIDMGLDESPSVINYLDGDGDGFGSNNNTVSGCNPPSGYVSVGGDCNDLNNAVYPGATDICDGLDNDCDGRIDEDLTVCGKTTGLGQSGITGVSANLSWNPVPCARKYRLFYRVFGSSSWNKIDIDVPNTTYQLTGLDPGTRYQWRIRTICTGTFSDLSKISYFTTASCFACFTPEGLVSGNSIDVFPNPGNGLFNLRLSSLEDQNASLTVLDNLGRNIYSLQLPLIKGVQTQSLDLSGYPDGVYFVKIQLAEDTYSKKVIKQ